MNNKNITNKVLINYLKTNTKLLFIIRFLFGFILKIVSLFVPIKEKSILFLSLGGRNFDDSPKAIYDEICSRAEFDDWTLIWVFNNPEIFEIPRGIKIKIDTFLFFKTLVSSKIWISNSSATRGFKIERNGIIRVETGHGSPIKKIGRDIESFKRNNFIWKYKKQSKDIIRCAQSDIDKYIYQKAYNIPKESFLVCGLPRNDSLFTYSSVDVVNLKEKMNIPKDKKIILYTPTYREYLYNEKFQTFLYPPINLIKWQDVLSDDYVLLIRAHYAVVKSLQIEENDFVIDVTDYPKLNDLYIISDLMISDYSSTFIDFSILERPMLCFPFDLKEYEEKRGLYFNLEKFLPCPIAYNEDKLLENILSLDWGECKMKVKKFKEKYAPNEGKASKAVVDEILKRQNK